MKNKILFLGRFPPPTHGASLMNEYYFNELSMRYNTKKIKINYSDSVEEIGKYNFKKLFGTLYALNDLIKSLLLFKPDLIYFEIAPKGIAFYRDSLFSLLCKLFQKKIIYQIHSKISPKGLYSRFIFNNSKLILLSPAISNNFKDLIDKNNLYFLPNGIPNIITDKEFNNIIQKRSKNKKLTLLFLGNMIKEKGSLEALEICSKLKGKFDYECLFVGAFPDKETENAWFKLRKDLNLEEECTYLGPKYGKEKQRILEKANYLIFPTRYNNETFPLVVLEAFMYGIPVFSYDNGAIKDIISDKTLGFVSNSSKNEIVKEIIKRTKIKENSSKIRSYFKKHFEISQASKKLSSIINKNMN